jgi:hypothetical protein
MVEKKLPLREIPGAGMEESLLLQSQRLNIAPSIKDGEGVAVFENSATIIDDYRCSQNVYAILEINDLAHRAMILFGAEA